MKTTSRQVKVFLFDLFGLLSISDPFLFVSALQEHPVFLEMLVVPFTFYSVVREPCSCGSFAACSIAPPSSLLFAFMFVNSCPYLKTLGCVEKVTWKYRRRKGVGWSMVLPPRRSSCCSEWMTPFSMCLSWILSIQLVCRIGPLGR